MKSKAQRFAVALIKFALPVLLISWLLWRIDAEQWEMLRQRPKNFPLLIAAWITATLAVSISLVRWAILVQCLGIRLSIWEAFRLGAIGYLLSFVSAGSVGGDVFKAIFLARRAPDKKVESVASVLVDRALGMYGLLVVVASALAFFPPQATSAEFQQITHGVAVLTGIGTIALVMLVTGGRWIDWSLQRISKWRWIGSFVSRIATPLRMFHDYPRRFVLALVMSLFVHVLLTLSIFMIASALYDDAPSFSDHLVIVPVGMIAAALPLTPAGLGVFEAAIEWLYSIIPHPPTQASGTLVALVFELVKIVLAASGVVFYWSGNREVRETIQAVDSLENEPA